MSSILGIGLQGLRAGFQMVNDASRKLSGSFSSATTEDPIKSILDLKQGERQVKASAAVVKVADELDQATLDIIA